MQGRTRSSAEDRHCLNCNLRPIGFKPSTPSSRPWVRPALTNRLRVQARYAWS
jgi:hypothetical protein